MFHDRKRGSLTVEATLVLPIFIFTVLIFVYFIKMVTIQENVNGYLSEVARKASQYAHVYNDLISNKDEEANKEEENTKKSEAKQVAAGFISMEAYSVLFSQCADTDYLDRTWIKDGSRGINFALSKFMEDEESIDIVARYSIHLPYAILGLNDIKCVQRIHTRGFVGMSGADEDAAGGDEAEGDDDFYVYITPTGTVYHKSRECTHLKLNISKVSGESIEALRNMYGGKYTPCERCISGANTLGGNYFYIAKQGNKYHTSLDCSGLKRTVKRVKYSTVKDRRPCSKCGR